LVEVSVNSMEFLHVEQAGATVKEATGAMAGLTVTLLLVEPLPPALVAVIVTVYGPAAAKVCCGYCDVDVPPSPKFQDQEVGELVDVSANWTGRPAIGYGYALYVKLTAGDPSMRTSLATEGTPALFRMKSM